MKKEVFINSLYSISAITFLTGLFIDLKAIFFLSIVFVIGIFLTNMMDKSFE